MYTIRHVSTQICIHIHIHTHTTCIRTYIHIHTNKTLHIHMYEHTYTHIYAIIKIVYTYKSFYIQTIIHTNNLYTQIIYTRTSKYIPIRIPKYRHV